MYLKYYLQQLGYSNIPDFLPKYLELSSLKRLKKVGYFCGMDYASIDIYNFREYISRYDHSLTVCLLTYKLTHDKAQALAGLFHDISTPCFSHVIDYMNKDYENQESTEEYTEKILKQDLKLQEYLKEDNINIEDIINFKKHTIVDNDRPKLCVDRIDGIILTGIGWTKDITLDDIKQIVNDLKVFKNNEGEDEIGFKSLDTAARVLEVSDNINTYCHSPEDTYMMQLLANITKLAIKQKYITYEDLYNYNEEELFLTLESKNNPELNKLLDSFYHQELSNIPYFEQPKIKNRTLKPLVNNQRLSINNITQTQNNYM